MIEDSYLDLQRKCFDKKEELYSSNKIEYPPIHTQLEVGEIIRLIPKESKNVVDFGSGSGRLTIPLLKRGFKVTAVDISEKSLQELRKNARKFGYKVKTSKNIKYVGKVDAIVGCDILHHLAKNFNFVNLRERLSTNGVIIFSEPNSLNPFWYPYIFLKRLWEVEKNIIYSNRYAVKKRFYKHGFKNIKITGLGLLPRVLFRSKILCKFNDRLGNLPVLRIFFYRLIILATN